MRIVMGVVALAALGSSALAADFPAEPRPIRPVAIAANPFQGAYATIGGAYGAGSERSANSSSTVSSGSFLVRPSGPSGIASIGYNVVGGNGWLAGIELDGRWGEEKGNAISNPVANVFTGFGVTSYPTTHTYDYKNDIAAHVSGRIGLTFDNTLVFAKGGVGMALLVETFSYTDPTTSASITGQVWVPSAVFGVGIEQNFGRAFVRAGAEMEAIYASRSTTSGSVLSVTSSSIDGPTWTTRGTLAAGLRF